jgi:hypothetical protein
MAGRGGLRLLPLLAQLLIICAWGFQPVTEVELDTLLSPTSLYFYASILR